ncbi:type II secretion system F family protein [Pullulanibacillus sp. KACC 23026]|uniref:type II secretion system F family protein n=1 Tax=Pullulanibacillus sp. KACC 23026 TaxID=3028315 RepID=UPI0023B1F4FD|nr:type II secretion system F family protein [Pullulanibacillus sp. KACC 23026]WEG13583.1 type II secretion system F family protein [Pullulanibacillus sp. KACC 23026]
MLYFAFFVTIFLFLAAIILVPASKQKKADRLAVYLDGELPQVALLEKEKTKGPSSFNLLIKSLWTRLAALSKKRVSPKKLARLELKLLKAGSPMNMSPIDFRLLQLVSLLGVSLLFGGMALAMHLSDTYIFLLVLVGIVYGAILPTTLLNSRIKRRAKEALRELPDFVDLLTVSLEAGLGFDAAISKVIEKRQGVLSDEFRLCLDHIRLGKTRREGLLGIKQRLEVEEIATLLNSIVRAEKLGVGMVQILRIQSVDVREKRRQRAEETAMKAPIKMLFPLVIFIFPSLFITILGPAVIQAISSFSGK